MQHGLATHQVTGAETFRPYFLALLAEAYGQGGQVDAGILLLEEALVAVHHHAEVFYKAELYRLKGELLQQRAEGGQQMEEVETLFHQALAIARGQQAKSLELRVAMSLSRLWQRQGKRDHARALLAEIYGWFIEGFEMLDLQEARALLQELDSHG
jgi:predicted ATPase